MYLRRFYRLWLVILTIFFCAFTLSALAQTEKPILPETSTKKKGNLSILSDPGGVKVFINEVPYGKTPLNLSLPAGTYNLRLEKAGYVTIKEEVKVKEGEDTALDFELEEKE